ncbi:alanine racemase [Lewinella aquimaris]|uniref:Alanine racemase n=1 Tax=Neolewinella aquimaris TaxID=1835722 RepID=A0A840DYM0_9BACT|nr:alanine racemase [Neolewinella aquimaris]MBB4078354.1 alanine racemase [Neolewinella aquimaris]
MREWHIPNIRSQLPELYRTYRKHELVVDSRLVGQGDRVLFFALSGERRDGHAFIAPLLHRGVRHFAVAADQLDTHRTEIEAVAKAVEKSQSGSSVTILIVQQPLELLQRLAAYHRRQFSIPVMGITGSNGKTIVKDWLTQLLSGTFRVCASPRSYNSAIGVPLSVWQLDDTHEVAVFEAGISRPGQMELLRDVIQPTCGALTSLGTAHLANFTSPEELRKEKLALFRDTEWLVAPIALFPDSPTAAEGENLNVLRWSGEGRHGLTTDGVSIDISLPDWPAPYLDNARTAVACAYRLGVPAEVLTTRVQHLVPLTNRLERREGKDGGPVINDSYSNDFSALAAAIQFANTHDPYGSVTLILGTVQPIAELATRLQALFEGRIHRLILVGESNGELKEIFPGAEYYSSVEDLIQVLPGLDFHRQTTLIKGASYEHFERVADLLTGQVHRTVLEINLPALRHNFRTYRSRLPAHTKVIVMAKASAYGSGALPVAQAVQDAGAEYLAVAYPEEGRDLRRGGITLPIMVLNAEAFSYPLLVEERLEPVVHNPEQLRLAAALGLPAHLELDTGMGRLGFRPEEFRKLYTETSLVAGTVVRSIFTHLAASEDQLLDEYTHRQLDLFDRLYQDYLQGGGARVQRHALNSNGITRFPRGVYDMVRLGIGLFGIGDTVLKPQLHTVLSLTTTVTAITDRTSGDSIGYGRRGIIDRNRRIAVLSIGYADGLPRLAGEGRFAVLIHGQLAPTIGSVCMDMTTVDVTEIAHVKVGDRVIIFGPDHPIEELADAARTIPYEILTGIGPRVHRVYLGE